MFAAAGVEVPTRAGTGTRAGLDETGGAPAGRGVITVETTAGDVGVGVVGVDAGVPLAQAEASATAAHTHSTIRGEGDVGLRWKRLSANKRRDRGLNTFSGYQRPRSSGIRARRVPQIPRTIPGVGVANVAAQSDDVS